MTNYQKFPQNCDFHKKNMKYWFSEDKWYIFKGKNIGKKCKFIKSSPKTAISIKKTQNIDFWGINDNFLNLKKGPKNGKSRSFQNFFFNFEIGHKKMSKMDFKKKVCKNENHFFFNFFFWVFFAFFLR